jgi:hypothetical protein
MLRLTRSSLIFVGISFVVFITYLLYLQSEVSVPKSVEHTDSKPAIHAGVVKDTKPAQEPPILSTTSYNFEIDRIKFNQIMVDIQTLVNKDTNSKIYEYINVKYEQNHFDDFSKMAAEFKELQRFWIVNRRLVNEAVTNGAGATHADIKRFIFGLLQKDAELSKHLADLEDYYYLMGRLEQKLVGWIRPFNSDIASLYDTYKPNSKAIIIGISNGYMGLGSTAVRAIREIHKSDIPIHVYYIGDGDLSIKNRQILQSMGANVFTHDITKLLDNRIIDLGGWALKPFAALLAPAEEVMLVDADITFIQSPDAIFKHPDYIERKALFFWDRAMWKNNPDNAKWVLSFAMSDKEFDELNPDYKYAPKGDENEKIDDITIPRRLQKSRYITLEAAHEQESGVVVINKRERFIPLLTSCNMNNKKERDEVSYKKFHGDKETFWTGFEMVGGQYAWNPNPPGMISDATFQPTEKLPEIPTVPHDHKWEGTHKLCSTQMLHFDHNTKPLWFNGGLYANKFSKHWGLGKFTHYIHGKKAKWSLGEANWVCMDSEDGEVLALSAATAKVVSDSEDILLQVKEKYGFDE